MFNIAFSNNVIEIGERPNKLCEEYKNNKLNYKWTATQYFAWKKSIFSLSSVIQPAKERTQHIISSDSKITEVGTLLFF